MARTSPPSTYPLILISNLSHHHQIAELSNLHTHLTLRSLRPAGSRKLGIPQGYGFSFVSCPNYFFECMAWFVVAGMTLSFSGTSPPFPPLTFYRC